MEHEIRATDALAFSLLQFKRRKISSVVQAALQINKAFLETGKTASYFRLDYHLL